MNNEKKLNKSNEELTAQIHGLSHDGRGIALINNKTSFISGSLPEEIVTYKITQKRSQYFEADALTIANPSLERTVPPCQHFGLCGGCSLQHMSTDAQIQLKQKTLLDQLKHFGKVTPEAILPPLQATELGYRRKARLGVKFVIKKDKLLIGFRERSSNYLAELERCVVLHPKIGEQFHLLRELVTSLESCRHIPQIEIAVGDIEAALVFRHLQPLSIKDREALITFGKTHRFHIYLQPNSPEPVTKIWPEATSDRLTYTLPDENIEMLFHPLDFTQINLEMNRLMVAKAMSLLDINHNESVLDLYCGIGNFTLPIAKRAKHVVGIEGGAEMVARAEENAQHNSIQNAEFFTGNLEKPNINAEWAKKRYDKLLLDPPRVGTKDILPLIPQFGAKRIVYVSCNPATLARDAGELVHIYKYRLQSAGIMNMFPHTSHVEAMAVFDKED